MNLRTAESILVPNTQGGGGFAGIMPTINEVETLSVVKQGSPFACGVACGATVLRDMGVNVTQDDIARAAGTDFVNGEELSSALKKVDNTAGTWYASELDSIFSNTERQSIIETRNASGLWIAQYGNVPSNPFIRHWVVVDGFDATGNLKIRDPWGLGKNFDPTIPGTRYTVTVDNFKKYWTGLYVYKSK
jgi:Peptidase_C39 like family